MAKPPQYVVEIFLSSACKSIKRAEGEATRMGAYGLQDDLYQIHGELARLLEDVLLNKKHLWASRI